MDQQLALSGKAVATSSTLGLNEQACNECKRRKGRCDRQLPECGPCERNRRHCLYEKHSKTPLTRKYLTSVEERLRQTELRARQLERRALFAEARLSYHQQGVTDITTARHSPEPQRHPSPGREASLKDEVTQIPGAAKQLDHGSLPNAQATEPGGHRSFNSVTAEWQYAGSDQQTPGGVDLVSPGACEGTDQSDTYLRTHDFEAPPSEADDFSWDEQSSGDRPDIQQQYQNAVFDDEEPSVTDGMASLSVEDRGAGYLGVASGAAMLRLLLPDAEYRGTLRRSSASYRFRSPSEPLPAAEEAQGWVPTPVYATRSIGNIDLDAAINAYFSLYHLSYPIVHEASFRAQYAQVIPRPAGRSWNALAYMIGAIGLFTTSNGPIKRDLDLFEAARANISIGSLESGNLTLVQVLILMSNYLQKRNKPNSGYNYIGLALHMAMGLGLHKEFHNWRISPLTMEIRRRVWWCLHVFAIGAIITFGRPLSWPDYGVEVALPLNIDDRDLTNVSKSLPPAREGITTYTAVGVQARFHIATNDIYHKIISVQFPRAAELVRLDDERIETWRLTWLNDHVEVQPRYRLSRSIMEWRYRNFRIIMYRPFVIRHALQQRAGAAGPQADRAMLMAVERCLHEAQSTITAIHEYWATCEHNCLGSWYGLYFIFQASLIPVMCLRNNPMSDQAASWRQQVQTVLTVFDAMREINPSSKDCRNMILKLCAGFLAPDQRTGTSEVGPTPPFAWQQQPVEESPQTQLSGVYPMMWPMPLPAEPDIMMPDHGWANFLTQVPSNPSTLGDETMNNFFWNQLGAEQNDWPPR